MREKKTTAKIALCREAMGRSFYERTAEIELSWLAAIAQENAVLLGPPGTAKSATVRALTSCVSNARIFDTLLSKFSTEDEVFGPVRLSALKQDRLERALDGLLADCEIGFLDEVFKANGSLLNSLLSALNERLYKGKPIPLRFCVAASNEMPPDDTAALWDRFVLRWETRYIQADTAWIDYMEKNDSDLAFVPPCTITVSEWDCAAKEASQIPIGKEVCERLLSLKKTLEANGIVASDRRWRKARKILRAQAWLDEAPEVTMDQFGALRFVLWNEPGQIESVVNAIDSVSKTATKEVLDILDGALRKWESRPTLRSAYREAIHELSRELEVALALSREKASNLPKSSIEKIKTRGLELRAASEQIKKDMLAFYNLKDES